MREGALFATMFGLGAGAVIVGVTVSRLVVGQAPEQPAEEPPPAAAVAPPPAIFAPPPAAVVAPATEPPAVASSAAPPIVVLSPAGPPAEAIQRQHRTVVRKHRRAPVREETPLATAAVPSGEAEAVVPPPTAVGDPPIGIVRGGAARPSPGARAPGPRIIQVDPPDGGR
jgi:hypothetical protein